MFASPIFIPLLHGASGILDELLLFSAPLVAVIVILVIASHRARKNASLRERPPHDASSNSTRPPQN
jgi:hypothetical protein